MNSNHPAIQQFLNAWLAEFGRAIEMFTGQQPSLGFSMTETLSIPKTAPALWMRQVFSCDSDFEIWIGAEEATWTELGKSLGDGPPDSLRSTYLEIVNQAQQGAATVTSLGLPTPIRCGNPETLSTARFDPAWFFLCDVELIDKAGSPIVIAVEQTALKVLDIAPIPVVEKDASGSIAKNVESSALRRMAGLSLPVSVSIGSTKLEITKVLRARTGSVISLAKDTSDAVDLLVDGVIVARGELVVVKGNYGFRVRQIVNQSHRISLCSN
jgi:flagellar motor switch protein FliN